MTVTDFERSRTTRCCPHCGSTRIYFDENTFKSFAELPPKPWYGFDPYCDPDYHGAWVCEACDQVFENPAQGD